jgi:hypothetical protein
MTKRTVATKWQRFTETARGYDPDPMGQIYQYDYPSGAIEIYKEPAGRYAPAQYMVDVYFADGSAERHSAPTLSKAKALGLSILRSRTNPAPRMNVRRNSEQKYVVTVDSGFSQTGYEGDRCYSFEATEKRLSQILAAEWSSFHGQHADFLNDLRTKGKARLGSSWSFIEAHAKKSNPARRRNSKSRR